MEKNQRGQAGKGIVPGAAQEGEGMNQYHASNPPTQTVGVPVASAYGGGYRNDGQGIQEKKREELQQRVKTFWERQMKEISENPDLKSQLPLTRIKKIMKFDDDVKMVSSEATMLLGKACELFIMELTMRSWAHVEDDRRKIIQQTDVASAISINEMFDFLVDVLPGDDTVPAMAGPHQVLPTPNQNTPYPYLSFPPPPYAAPGNASSSSAANPPNSNFNPIPDQQHPSNTEDH
ncbi:nuclear transcription factor Y subunit C-3-like [Vigna unguiculata]|uniref:nuclear transcription factor Y subunit C-3-like n=1 Tax=Vigna unguiculata TaxID=3917 RepID=UPI001016FDDE|nr:nuclear transcription factor Y subunit C-3-like [Vigna unguiculata]XP_027930309.1 nuclear transcription factor Y subunit C-3-like [Vigna unguiculata]